jgi:plastocyanin
LPMRAGARCLALLGMLALAGCAGPSGPSTAPGAQAGQVEVVIAGSRFVPAGLTIRVGQQVRWTNEDDQVHTVTFDDGVDGGRMSRGSHFTRAFRAPGSYPYRSATDPASRGVVTVVR